jgi:hypothetical membrane protein
VNENSIVGLAKTNILLTCGVAAGPLFVFVFVVQGATRSGYDPCRYPVSSLSIGPLGWIQIVNFIGTGCLLVAFALGLRKALRVARPSFWGPLLIGIAGIGLVGAGAFVSDPVFGYPSDLPLKIRQFTVRGQLHDLSSTFFFVGLPASCFVLARRYSAIAEHKWAVYSVMTGILMPVAFILTSIGFNQRQCFVAIGGLLQRLTIAIGMSWLTSIAFQRLMAFRRCGTQS